RWDWWVRRSKKQPCLLAASLSSRLDSSFIAGSCGCPRAERRRKHRPEAPTKNAAHQRGLMIVSFLAGVDLDRQLVSRRGQRTGRVRGKSAGRVLRLVEIEDRFSVDQLVGVKKSAA